MRKIKFPKRIMFKLATDLYSAELNSISDRKLY